MLTGAPHKLMAGDEMPVSPPLLRWPLAFIFSPTMASLASISRIPAEADMARRAAISLASAFPLAVARRAILPVYALLMADLPP